MADSQTRQTVVRRVVDLLASRDYMTLETMSKGVRLSASDLADAVREYGCTLLPLPVDADNLIDYIPIRSATPVSWTVVVPLFTHEEGRSDLSLELTLRADGQDSFSVELDNLHVL